MVADGWSEDGAVTELAAILYLNDLVKQHQTEVASCRLGDIKHNKAASFLLDVIFHTAESLLPFVFIYLFIFQISFCSASHPLTPFVGSHLASDQAESLPAPQSETAVILTQNKTLSLFQRAGSRCCLHITVLHCLSVGPWLPSLTSILCGFPSVWR